MIRVDRDCLEHDGASLIQTLLEQQKGRRGSPFLRIRFAASQKCLTPAEPIMPMPITIVVMVPAITPAIIATMITTTV
jgi:hypothetical protein